MLSPHPPTLSGMATFSAGLVDSLDALGVAVTVVRVDDGTRGDDTDATNLISGSSASAAACVEVLNRNDVAIAQYGGGVYGGADGAEIVEILSELRIPSIVVARSAPNSPTRQQRSVMEAIAALASQLVVMSEAAGRRLRADYNIDGRKVVTIPHGAHVPVDPVGSRRTRPTIVTWGLLGPGKGIERVIGAMRSLRDLPGRPRYLVVGQTDPRVLAVDGEAYRESLVDQVRSSGLTDSVFFEDGYRDPRMLSVLAQSAAVIALPYDSTDQAASGVLVDAIANGRPVVATSFPHAVEALATGAGIVVDHNDQEAMEAALRRVLTQPRLAGDMAAEARRLAPELAWPTVADAYLRLARRLMSQLGARL